MKKRLFLLLFCAILTVFCVAPRAFAENFETTAKSAVVMEKSTHRVLYEYNADQKLPMASTTKIMTALVVAENSEPSQVVTVPKQAVGVEGSSVYLREGEKLTVKELLYGLMLRSGNDCAVALALATAGSLENFAEMMNKKAQELGCNNTHFVTPHGLPCENHYTTARDLAVISCNALQNGLVAEVVSTKSVKIANDGYDYPRVLTNKNKLLTMLDGADGVKTGYTKKAGRCFVGSATKNGMQVVAVVLDCGPMFEEVAKMLRVAFENYSLVTVIPKNKIFCADGDGHVCRLADGFSYPLTENERQNVTICVQNGKNGATVDVMLFKQLIFSAKLVTI